MVLRRAFAAERVWLEAGGFARLRDGAASIGADIASGSSVDGLVPGAFASVRLVAQPGLGAWGANATGGLRQRLPLGPRSSLWPELSATWRRAEPSASARPDVDADVYSAYALSRPWSVDAKTVLDGEAIVMVPSREVLRKRG